MTVSNQTIFGNMLHLKAYFRSNDLTQKYASDEPPLRAELFSSAQMEQHGKTLAGLHQLSPGHAPDQLLPRLMSFLLGGLRAPLPQLPAAKSESRADGRNRGRKQ